MACAGEDGAVLSCPVIITDAFSVVGAVSVRDAEGTVRGAVAVAATVLVTDWVTCAIKF